MPREEHYLYSFALVICRQPSTGKWLTVKEKKKGSPSTTLATHDTSPYVYWLPGGGVERGETFPMAAVRETLEEAGISIVLKGILRIEHTVLYSHERMRVIYYAEPVDEHETLKTVPDSESEGAYWLTTLELQLLKVKNELRGEEILNWAKFIENGGIIYPLELLTEETSGPVVVNKAINNRTTKDNTNSTTNGGAENL